VKRAKRVRPSVAILGCGAVGEAFALTLVSAWRHEGQRAELLLWSRRRSRARRLCEKLAVPGLDVRALDAPEDAFEASVAVLLCLPDAVIAPFAARLARSVPRGRVLAPVLHTNGLLGTEALDPLQREGLAAGKLHPLWAVSRAYPHFLPAVSFGIAGDPPALRAARALVRTLGGRPLLLGNRSGPRYHAAASLLAGGVVALIEQADRLLGPAVPSVDDRRRRDALVMLARSSLLNVSIGGTRAALTGAIARGAEETVRGHLRALRHDPDALDAYRVLGRTMLELARARGSIDADAGRRIERLIRAPGRKR